MFKVFYYLCFLMLSHSILNGMSTSIANSWANKAIGEIGEGMMRSYFQYTGWEQIKVPTPNSINGIDGVFVKRAKNGVIEKAIIVESKVNTSQEGFLITGEQQGSKAYNLRKIDIGLSLTKNDSMRQDLMTIKEKIQNDTARSIEHRVILENGKVQITHRTLTSPKENINFISKGPSRIVASFDYNSPKNTYEKFISKSIKDETLKFFSNPNKNMQLSDINKIVQSLGTNGNIRDILSNGLKEIPDIRTIPEGFNAFSPQGKVFARTLPQSSIIRVPNSVTASSKYFANSLKTVSSAGGAVCVFETGNALYEYINSDISTGELYSRIQDGVVDGAVVATSSTVIKPVLSAILPDGRLLCATNAGMFVVSIEMGLASVELWKGNIDLAEFERKATESIIKGVAVEGASYMALYLGATPGGLVVLAIGTGAYLITDLGIKEYQRRQWVHQTSIQELAKFRIVNRDNPLNATNKNNPLKIENTSNPLNIKNRNSPFFN